MPADDGSSTDLDAVVGLAQDVECFVGTHLILSATSVILFMMVFAIGIPAFQLYKIKHDLKNAKKRKVEHPITKMYGLHFLPFKADTWYWGTVLLARKVCCQISNTQPSKALLPCDFEYFLLDLWCVQIGLVLCLVCLKPFGANSQAISGFVVLQATLLYHIKYHSFFHPDADVMETISISMNTGGLSL